MEPRLPLETTNEPTDLLPMGTLLAYNPMATIQSPMIRATPRMEPRLPLGTTNEPVDIPSVEKSSAYNPRL